MALRIMTLAVALLVVATGCKTPPIAHVTETLEPFVLLDQGREPRSLLRYIVPKGAITRVTMDVRITTTGSDPATQFVLGLRNSTIELVAGPAQLTMEGMRFPLEVAKATAKGADPQDIAWAESLVGAAAVIETDLRGNVIWAETNERAAKLSARTRLAIVTASFGLVRVVLPEEPVGLGARWQTRARVAVLDFTILQLMTYSWVDRVEDNLVIDLDYKEIGEPQQVDFVGARSQIRGESLKIDGRGKIHLDLNALMSAATGSGAAIEELVLDEDGAERNVVVEETFGIEVQRLPAQGSPAP